MLERYLTRGQQVADLTREVNPTVDLPEVVDVVAVDVANLIMIDPIGMKGRTGLLMIVPGPARIVEIPTHGRAVALL